MADGAEALTVFARLPPMVKSFLRLFAVMTAVATVVSALPTYLDLDRNRQAEFYAWRDGHPLARAGSGECVIALAAVADRFLMYFAFVGGVLLVPFGIYLVLLAAKMMLTRSAWRERHGGAEDRPP